MTEDILKHFWYKALNEVIEGSVFEPSFMEA